VKVRSKFVLIVVLTLGAFVFADTGRKIVKQAPVAYPDMARRLHLAGNVKLEVQVLPNGKVKKVAVLGGHPILANAATETVAKWEYQPAPTETTESVLVKFDQQ
jgi:TonB family protein